MDVEPRGLSTNPPRRPLEVLRSCRSVQLPQVNVVSASTAGFSSALLIRVSGLAPWTNGPNLGQRRLINV